MPSRPRVMDQRVHLPADQRGGRVVAEQPRARGVAEHADAAQVDAVDRFGRGVEQQADPLFALGDLLARAHELRDVARDRRDADDRVRRDRGSAKTSPTRRPALPSLRTRVRLQALDRRPSRTCWRIGVDLVLAARRDTGSWRAGRSPRRRCSRTAACAPLFQLVMMPSSVLPTIASSDDSTIAESCASRARACSSAEMSVSVSTTPSGRERRRHVPAGVVAVLRPAAVRQDAQEVAAAARVPRLRLDGDAVVQHALDVGHQRRVDEVVREGARAAGRCRAG